MRTHTYRTTLLLHRYGRFQAFTIPTQAALARRLLFGCCTARMVVSGVKRHTPSTRSSSAPRPPPGGGGFPTRRWTPAPARPKTPPPPANARPIKPTDDAGLSRRHVAGRGRDALDDVRATLSPANVRVLRQRAPRLQQQPRLPPAHSARPLPPGTMPTPTPSSRPPARRWAARAKLDARAAEVDRRRRREERAGRSRLL